MTFRPCPEIWQLQTEGWITRGERENRTGKLGRPRRVFKLTPDGDHLFTKSYADLAVEIVDTVADQRSARIAASASSAGMSSLVARAALS